MLVLFVWGERAGGVGVEGMGTLKILSRPAFDEPPHYSRNIVSFCPSWLKIRDTKTHPTLSCPRSLRFPLSSYKTSSRAPSPEILLPPRPFFVCFFFLIFYLDIALDSKTSPQEIKGVCTGGCHDSCSGSANERLDRGRLGNSSQDLDVYWDPISILLRKGCPLCC